MLSEAEPYFETFTCFKLYIRWGGGEHQSITWSYNNKPGKNFMIKLFFIFKARHNFYLLINID